jgi:hypothetical protein
MFKTTVKGANRVCTAALYLKNSLLLRHCKRKSKREGGRNVIIVRLSSLQWIADTKAAVDTNWEF